LNKKELNKKLKNPNVEEIEEKGKSKGGKNYLDLLHK
jgi:hypothetical protein